MLKSQVKKIFLSPHPMDVETKEQQQNINEHISKHGKNGKTGYSNSMTLKLSIALFVRPERIFFKIHILHLTKMEDIKLIHNSKMLNDEGLLTEKVDELSECDNRVTSPTFTNHEFDKRVRDYTSKIENPFKWNEILYPGYFFSPQHLNNLQDMLVFPDDVILATYPKSGTTWASEIISLITNNGDLDKISTLDISQRIVHIEALQMSLSKLATLARPRLLQTHLPYSWLPPAIKAYGCKIVYVMRNPKDLAVSFYYHHKMAIDLGCFDKSFQTFLSLFLEEKVCLGSWFEHVKSYWKHNYLPNICIIRYEDMKINLPKVVEKLASFLGYSFTEAQISGICDHCSFNKMKGNPHINRSQVPIFDSTKSPFIRKGIIGDWKNHFNKEDNFIFDTVYDLKMKDVPDLHFIYE